MDFLSESVKTLNSLSPLGLAALLSFVIYKLIEGNRRLKTVQTNHLHELPEMAETLRRIEKSLNEATKDQVSSHARMLALLERLN